MRRLLVGSILVALGVALIALWLDRSVRRQEARSKALAALSKLGADVSECFGAIWFFEPPFQRKPLIIQLQPTENVTRVTDSDLAHLKEIPELRILDLAATQITGTGLKYLQRLEYLTTLTLNHVQLSDQALSYVGRIAALQDLYLNNTAVSDSGLAKLHSLHNLFWLDLDDTRVTEKGLFALQSAIPNVTIFVGPEPRESIPYVSFDGVYVELGQDDLAQDDSANSLGQVDYAVLNAVLSGDFRGKRRRRPVNIAAVTMSVEDVFDSGWEDRWILAQRRRGTDLEDLDRDMIVSWEQNNLRRYHLGSTLSPSVAHRISPLRQKTKSDGSPTWTDFAGAFTGEWPFVLISRPGFNAEGTEAIVYIREYFDGAVGMNEWLVLAEKVSGQWQIRSTVLIDGFIS